MPDSLGKTLLLFLALTLSFAGGISLGAKLQRDASSYHRWTSACVAAHGTPHRDIDAQRCYRSLDTLNISREAFQ